MGPKPGWAAARACAPACAAVGTCTNCLLPQPAFTHARALLPTGRRRLQADIEAFVAADPYFKNGLVPAYTIKPFAVVVGDP